MTSVTTFSWTANLSSSRRLHTAFDIRQMDGGRFHDTFLTQILPLILLAIEITIDQPQKTMRMCFKYIPLVWEVLINYVWQLAGRNLQPPLSNTKKTTVHVQNGSIIFVGWSMKFWGKSPHSKPRVQKKKNALGALVGMVVFCKKFVLVLISKSCRRCGSCTKLLHLGLCLLPCLGPCFGHKIYLSH